MKKGFTNDELQEKINKRYYNKLNNQKNGFVGDNLYNKYDLKELKQTYSNINKKKYVSFIIVLILMISIVFYTFQLSPIPENIIDGKFNGWDNSINLTFANMDIIKNNNSQMFIHLNKTNMFKGQNEKADCYLIFINNK